MLFFKIASLAACFNKWLVVTCQQVPPFIWSTATDEMPPGSDLYGYYLSQGVLYLLFVKRFIEWLNLFQKIVVSMCQVA